MLEARGPVSGSRARRTERGARPRPTVSRAKVAKVAAPQTRSRPQTLTLSTTSRCLILLIVMVLCAGGLVSRLVFWQILQQGQLSAIAVADHAALDVQIPTRGEIVDAAGTPLAMDVTMNRVFAAPKQIKDPGRTAALLAPVLGESIAHLKQLFTQESALVVLDPRAGIKVSQQIRNLALPGIIIDAGVQRYYPDGTLASQVLGFTNTDQVGQSGIEAYYDQILSGKAGFRTVLKDTAGNDIHLGSVGASPAHNGAELHLSLDPLIQGLAEQELRATVKAQAADGGTIIVMDPHTGYVLGMAGSPTFNPNTYGHSPYSTYLNTGTQWTYEPGSTFKIVTMAAGLDAHVITPQSAFEDTGQWTVAGTTLRNWNLQGNGWENMTQVLQHSANVGASWVANRLGTTRFYRYVRRFRFGKPTGIDLADEWPGTLWLPGSKNWTIVNLYTNSFGQALAVTPIQLIRAVSAVANGGVMMKPQVVKRVIYDGQIVDRHPVSQGRVISAQTAHTLTDMLVRSAINGEASAALVKGYNIAAKTGTANIAGPGGTYLPGATIASTVAYAPAFHPRFVALVIIRHPRHAPWGSVVAAPVIHTLFRDLFMRYHIPPSPHALNK